jgi:glycosyltransferase involved in cell wall biosynthesis
LDATRPVILILIKGLGIGGAERLISEAAVHWDRTTFDYRVAYVIPHKDQLVEELRAQAVEVVQIGGPRGMGLRAMRELRQLVKESGASIVHAHLPATGILARLVSTVPVVYTEHNVVTSYRVPTRIMNRLSYGLNRVVIAVSDAVAQSLSGYPGPTPMVIRNGVTCAVSDLARQAARSELGLSPTSPLVAHVGNIRPHKGHMNLISAVELLKATVPDVLVASIGGEKAPGDLERLRAEAARRGLENSIRFLGRREDARSFLAAADVVVNPSDVEGLPIAVLEAMSLGRPVVATAVGGVPSLVVDGVTGRLVPQSDPQSLADAMSELLLAPDSRATMGRHAETLIADEYGLDRMVRSVEDVYRGILG